ncbi:MAG: PAS domain-containing protein, partial [Persicimonas sp.]
MEKSPELTVVLAADSPDFTVVAASDAYLEMMTLSRDELIGRPVFDAFPENPGAPESVSVERIRTGLLRVIQDREPVSHGPFRFDIPRTAGGDSGFEKHFWSPRSLPVFDDDGEVDYILHRVENVTDYVMREQSRGLEAERDDASTVIGQFERAVEERSRRQFYKLFMQAPAFIAVLEGPDHVFTLANPAYHDLVGQHALVGCSVRDVFPEQKISPFIELLDEVYTTGEPRHFEEQAIQLRSPSTDADLTRYATFVYLPNYDLQGEIEGVAVFGFEVTELVEARNKLAEQAARAEAENRHKDEFLAMLGHELRNPMAPIATAVDLVRSISVEEAPDKVDWAVDIISRQLGQLRRLVDDLLDVARINRGRIELERQRYKLDEVITAAIQMCEPLIEQKDQTLRVELPEPPVEIDVDPELGDRLKFKGRRATFGLL